MTIWKELISRM